MRINGGLVVLPMEGIQIAKQKIFNLEKVVIDIEVETISIEFRNYSGKDWAFIQIASAIGTKKMSVWNCFEFVRGLIDSHYGTRSEMYTDCFLYN